MKIEIDGDKITCPIKICGGRCFDIKPAKKSDPRWQWFHAVCHQCGRKFGVIVRPTETAKFIGNLQEIGDFS